MRTVYVATRDIPIGTTGAQLASGGWLVARKFAGNSVASGAVVNTTTLSNLVAIQPTYAGEQIVARRFGTAQQEGLLSDLKGVSRVMELPGDAHQLLAGTLKQGNRVDVIGNVTNPEGSQNHSTVIALRNLLVVKAPSSPSSSRDRPGSVGRPAADRQAGAAPLLAAEERRLVAAASPVGSRLRPARRRRPRCTAVIEGSSGH